MLPKENFQQVSSSEGLRLTVCPLLEANHGINGGKSSESPMVILGTIRWIPGLPLIEHPGAAYVF